MASISVYQAHAELSRLIERRPAGGEIVITRRGTPVPQAQPRRKPGALKGKLTLPESFFDPLPDDIIDAFYASEIFLTKSDSIGAPARYASAHLGCSTTAASFEPHGLLSLGPGISVFVSAVSIGCNQAVELPLPDELDRDFSTSSPPPASARSR